MFTIRFRKTLTQLVVFVLLMVSPLFAMQEGNIKKEMGQKIADITKVLQNKKLTTTEQKKKILPMVDTVFDYKTMSKISLGTEWKKLTVGQQKKFIQKFEDKLKNSYFEKLDLYTNEKVTIKGLEKVKATRIKFYTDIVGKEETYEIVYKFYKVKNSENWLIYDLEITGVSVIQAYRKQFAAFLKTKPFSQLVDSL
jgi:phospholipid transport system substrate-binding protein